MMMRRPLSSFVLLVIFISIHCHSASGGLPELPTSAENGMVVSGHYLSSEIGIEILKNGGNAIDAAIATGFALAVNLPAAGNIGGGGFMIVRTSQGEFSAFDFREKAPLAAHSKMFLDAEGNYDGDINHRGHRSVGVPGTVAGFFLAHQKYGSMSMPLLLEPAIKMAEEGFVVTQGLADSLKNNVDNLREYPGSAAVFLKKHGNPYEAGEVWRQPALAKSLRRIQRHGRKGFYEGETARLITSEMQRNGGLITQKDLMAYQAVERVPVWGTYRDHQIISMPPPSSGGIALIQMLNILETFDFNAMGFGSARHLHLEIEAMRRAFADRARYLGDPDFNSDMPVTQLLSKQRGALLRESISLNRASKSDEKTFNESVESNETTHYSVVDSHGNVAVVTYTLEGSYGSYIVPEGAGFLLNNEMGDFNPVPGITNREGLIGTAANLVAPEKRMLSSMTPTIVLRDDKPFLLIGSPGGRSIINTVLQIIVNTIDFEMNISEAIKAPRLHHQWLPDQVKIETEGFSMETLERLRAIGHTIQPYDSNIRQGRAMGILLEPSSGTIFGASDPRSADGAAVGY